MANDSPVPISESSSESAAAPSGPALPKPRHGKSALDAYLICASTGVALPGLKTLAHCHFVALDAQNRDRVKALATKLRTQIVDYAIPRKHHEEAKLHQQQTSSTEKHILLDLKAKQLFVAAANSGEPGEVLLYLLCDAFLQLPQVLCKMSLKTSSAMHVHGIDGIHASVDAANGRLALHWGEAKLHANASQAINAAFDSVAPFLIDDGGRGSAQQRDLELLRDNVDFADDALVEAFKKYLDPDDPLFLQLEHRAVCLIGFDYSPYGNPFEEKQQNVVRAEVQKAISDWYSKASTRISAKKLESFHIDVLCLPFPSVEEFRKLFREELGQ
jgi:hypothetical protein